MQAFASLGNSEFIPTHQPIKWIGPLSNFGSAQYLSHTCSLMSCVERWIDSMENIFLAGLKVLLRLVLRRISSRVAAFVTTKNRKLHASTTRYSGRIFSGVPIFH